MVSSNKWHSTKYGPVAGAERAESETVGRNGADDGMHRKLGREVQAEPAGEFGLREARAHEATPHEEGAHPHALQRRGRVQEAYGAAGDP